MILNSGYTLILVVRSDVRTDLRRQGNMTQERGPKGRRDGRDDRFSGRDYLIGGINGRNQ